MLLMCEVSQSVFPSVLQSVCHVALGFTVRGHSVQLLPKYFGLLFLQKVCMLTYWLTMNDDGKYNVTFLYVLCKRRNYH